MAERHATEEALRANDLVQRSPGHALRRPMNLVGSHLFEAEPIGLVH
jgi:hypothetical protein